MDNAKDIVWIRCGHLRIMSGNELSVAQKRCNRDADIWRIQRGTGRGHELFTVSAQTRPRTWTAREHGCGHGLDKATDWMRTVFGLDTVADWARTVQRAGLWRGHSASKPRLLRGHENLSRL